MLVNRIQQYSKNKNSSDLVRKIIHYISYRSNIFSRIRNSYRAWLYFKNSNIILGSNVRLKGLGFDIRVADGFHIYDNCIFELAGRDPRLHIGTNCLVSYGVLISCHHSIQIGNDVMIGEYTSIRDTTHQYQDPSRPMKSAGDRSEAVSIGNNIWVGRGCLIMPGTVIEDGVVIAANSVVRGRLQRNGIYGGAPAKFIKSRLA